MPEITTDWNSTGCIKDGIATLACIPVVLQNLINGLVVLAGVVCVFLVVYAGYKFVMSEGDPEKVAQARKTLIYAILGFIFVLASFMMLNAISNFTGVEQLAPSSSAPGVSDTITIP